MIKTLAVLTSLLVLSFFSCAHDQPAPQQSTDISALEKKVAETNEKVDDLVQRMSVLQLMVDTQQRTLQDLKNEGRPPASISSDSIAVNRMAEKPPEFSAPVAAAPLKASPPPPDADALYQKAFGLFQARRFQAAVTLFDTFTARYPHDSLADNALFWAGECRYALNDYAGAVRSFNSVIKNYPDGNKVPDSLLKIGYSYLALGDHHNGVDYLKRVIKNHPFSPAATKAEQKLKLVTIR